MAGDSGSVGSSEGIGEVTKTQLRANDMVVMWRDGVSGTLPYSWLWDSSHGAGAFDPNSQQRCMAHHRFAAAAPPPETYKWQRTDDSALTAKEDKAAITTIDMSAGSPPPRHAPPAALANPSALVLRWCASETTPEHVATYDADWLRAACVAVDGPPPPAGEGHDGDTAERSNGERPGEYGSSNVARGNKAEKPLPAFPMTPRLPSSVEPWAAGDIIDETHPLGVRPAAVARYEDVISGADGGAWIATLRRFGFVMVEGTPATSAATQAVVERLGPVQHTFWGGMWETFVDDSGEGAMAQEDSAYGQDALAPHTDGNYLDDPPGLQVFHCLEPARSGGETLLVDGFHVARQLAARDQAAFRLLCRLQVPYRFRSPSRCLDTWHPVFGLDPAGRVATFRFNEYDRGLMPLFTKSTADDKDEGAMSLMDGGRCIHRQFFQAWQALVAITQDPNNVATVALRPGGMILIDNQRVMHGRTRILDGVGRRLAGCYVSRASFEQAVKNIDNDLS